MIRSRRKAIIGSKKGSIDYSAYISEIRQLPTPDSLSLTTTEVVLLCSNLGCPLNPMEVRALGKEAQVRGPFLPSDIHHLLALTYNDDTLTKAATKALEIMSEGRPTVKLTTLLHWLIRPGTAIRLELEDIICFAELCHIRSGNTEDLGLETEIDLDVFVDCLIKG